MNYLTHTEKIERGNQIAARVTGRHPAYGEQHMTTQKTKAVSGNEPELSGRGIPAGMVLYAAILVVLLMCAGVLAFIHPEEWMR